MRGCRTTIFFSFPARRDDRYSIILAAPKMYFIRAPVPARHAPFLGIDVGFSPAYRRRGGAPEARDSLLPSGTTCHAADLFLVADFSWPFY